MKTFNQAVNDFITLTQDASGTALAKTLLNIGIKKTLGLADFSFNKDTKNYSTGTSIQEYERPYNAQKIDYVWSWYGNRWWMVQEVKNEQDWRILNAVSVTSSIPTHWHILNDSGNIGVFPYSVDSKGTIKAAFTKKVKDYGASDYSTGSIAGSANGTIFTGSGGASWGSTHIGRYIQIGNTSTQADGFWFEISNVVTSTSLIVKERIPDTFTAGSGTYVISEVLPFPDGFETAPLYFALEMYYKHREVPALSQQYGLLYREEVENLKVRDGKTTQGLVQKEYPITQISPNSNPWAIELE